jgi:MGT family glycosyltransferase
MERFLFAVPPLVGHVNPTVAVARELESRGHAAAWVGHPGTVRPLLPEGATLYALDDRVPAEMLERVTARANAVRGLAGLKFLWEDFLVPLAAAMVSGVEAAVDSFRPSVIVSDQQALAGALVARRRELPFATFATTSAGVTDPLAGLPRVRDWVEKQVLELQRRLGLPDAVRLDESPVLVVVFSTEALVGPLHRFPAHYRFVGPSIRGRPDATPFPFDALRPGTRVLLSLGTVNAERGERFYATAALALAEERLQVILAAPPELVGRPPENFVVRARVPQLALLPHVHAVVCHAGHNTVCEALAHGLPLVVAPIKDDQPVIAQQVADAGAGIRVRFGRVDAAGLREAVRRVLGEPSFREAAARVQASFAAAGGSAAAADAVEELA